MTVFCIANVYILVNIIQVNEKNGQKMRWLDTMSLMGTSAHGICVFFNRDK